MESQTTGPALTYFPPINNLIADLHGRLVNVLAADYAGLVVHGSLALGDFNPATSDIDLLVITREPLTAAEVAVLAEMHERLADDHPGWAPRLEASYLPHEALRRHDPAHPAFPRLAAGQPLVVEPHHSDWIIQRHILREYGLTYFGPPPALLIDRVDETTLKTAVLDIRWWWEEQIAAPVLLLQDAYQVYAVLSMCRMLVTLHTGEIVSKPAAARWARDVVARPYAALINAALAWGPTMVFNQLVETAAFVRFTLDETKQF